MIALIYDGTTGAGDTLNIFVPPALVLAASLDWYCSWEIYPLPGSGLPFNRSFAPYPASGVSTIMTIAPVPTAQVEYVIREVSVRNPSQDPVDVFIQIVNGAITVNLFNCLLGAGHKLKYNAAPGANMGWQIFDGAGNLTSANS